MKTRTIATALLVLGLSTFMAVPAGAASESKPTTTTKPTRVVLIGASIGKNWNLPDLPARLGRGGFEFEALQAWEYDKSALLDEVLMRPARKFHLTRTYLTGFFQPPPQPADVIVLKECSAYFPGDLSRQQKQDLVERWVRQARERSIKVVLATAVPVTKKRAQEDPGKQESVLAFNDWLREYARKNGIELLDLEAATRTDERERFLRADFANDDGSHVNRKAYDVLDHLMWAAVCSVNPGPTCK
jgi:hypothetical protein